MVTIPPVARPVTSPDVATVAIAGLLLFHIPPGMAQSIAADEPTHMLAGPVMLAGAAFTVIGLVA
jgi:hypothetical protein